MSKIPKIIHQIWIGPNKKPDIWMNTFSIDYLKKFPSWKYKLWNDNNISELFDNQSVILQIYDNETSYNGKSDILRYLILKKYGGIYVDADSVWINDNSFDDILKKVNETNFFISYESSDKKLVCGGIMGSSINNEYINIILDSLRNMIIRWDNTIRPVDYIRKRRTHGPATLIGPGLLTKLFIDNKKITILNHIHFYPVLWHNNKDLNPDSHLELDLPKESITFQYGYSTNNFKNKI